MRFRLTGFIAIVALLAAALPGLAAAQYESTQGRSPPARDDDVSREEVRQKERELREMKRELRRKEQQESEAARDADEEEEAPRRRARRHDGLRAWVGGSYGVMYGSAEVPCQSSTFGDDCTEEGIINTYGANVTVANAMNILRFRGLRDADKGDEKRTPYEEAALVGTRFGQSDWYGMVGYGRVRHVDDRYPKDHAEGFAWEIIFAPSAQGVAGLELSFHGNNGHDVDIVGFSAGLRLGALR